MAELEGQAALEGQRLVAELFPDSGSEPEFEGFHANEPAGNLSGENDSGSEVGHLSDAAAAAAYRTKPNLPDYGSSAWPTDSCVRLLYI